MIYAIIAIIVEAIIIVALAILAIIAILDSNRQARGWAAARKGNEEYRNDHARLQQALEATQRLYTDLLAEYRALEARNTALVEAMEARPTQPKRTVRKNSIARIDISEGEPL